MEVVKVEEMEVEMEVVKGEEMVVVKGEEMEVEMEVVKVKVEEMEVEMEVVKVEEMVVVKGEVSLAVRSSSFATRLGLDIPARQFPTGLWLCSSSSCFFLAWTSCLRTCTRTTRSIE